MKYSFKVGQYFRQYIGSPPMNFLAIITALFFYSGGI